MDEKQTELADVLRPTMRLAHRLHNRLDERLSAIGLYRGQPPILHALMRKGTMSQKDLADDLGLSPATITVTLKRMEKAGLVSRSAEPADLRVQRVEVTDLGREMGDKAWKVFTQVHAQCAEYLSPQEQETYRRLTEKLHQKLDEED